MTHDVIAVNLTNTPTPAQLQDAREDTTLTLTPLTTLKTLSAFYKFVRINPGPTLLFILDSYIPSIHLTPIVFASCTGSAIFIQTNDNPLLTLPCTAFMHPNQYTPNSRYYSQIQEALSDLEIDNEYTFQFSQRALSKNTQTYAFKVTPDIKAFIERYAPPYGYSVPIWEEEDSTSDTYLPKQWYRAYEEMTGKTDKPAIRSPEKAIAKWDLAIKQSRLPTPLGDIERVYLALKYYTHNNLPFEDNWTDCPICGHPAEIHFNNYDRPLCVYCETEVNTPIRLSLYNR